MQAIGREEARAAQRRADESRASAKDSSADNANELPNFMSPEFVEVGKKRIEALMELQKEMFDALQEINQAWFARARSEANLNTELLSKLTSARSVPETTEAYQQIMGKRMELFVEDGRRLIADGQKIVNLSTRFLANGSAANGSAA